MNSLNLKYFIAVAEELSVTKAANKLFISQQSLSQQISRLEKEYQAVFFERTPHMKLTYAGELMLDYARHAVRLEQDIRSSFETMSASTYGSVRIGVRRSHSHLFLPEIIKVFSVRYPNIKLKIVEDTSSRLAQKILTNEVDIAIVSCRFSMNPKFFSRRLMDENYSILIPENLLKEYCSIPLEDAKQGKGLSFIEEKTRNMPILLTSTAGPMRQAVDSFLMNNGIIRPNILLEGGNMHTAYLLCSQGIGINFTYDSLWRLYTNIYSPKYSLYSFNIDSLKADPSSFLCCLKDSKPLIMELFFFIMDIVTNDLSQKINPVQK